MKDEVVKIILVDDGPMIVNGDFTVIGSNSEPIIFTPTQLVEGVAICCCGKSKKMPLCDGSHVKK